MYHYLYLSRFTGRVGETGLRDILQRSREKNVLLGITGALLFDGERFVQLLEGTREQVLTLAARIRVDDRHTDFEVVYEAEVVSGARRFRRWLAGYSEPESVTTLERSIKEVDPSPVVKVGVVGAMDAFMALVETSDLE